ncbi:uS10/mL48 family ribosomal protein [Natronoarchaeum rubrum]|uniref:uS10/mL48 family ribosomal protein n=1 Tax=Natronoarchaeum rubrum TaxID=755311 RepID=UPI0021135D57|nr:uS10/mL48 family ribosomal protein [Natronoarchaeum rubrum]HMB50801.1 uS10/mL48 family ribosomal protein [Natronoarchaeum rubrum]
MTFVTKLRLQSGDRAVLDSEVEDIKDTAERKGAELKGPHSKTTQRMQVPLSKDTTGGGRLGSWDYTVYSREVEIVGHDDLARRLAAREFPEPIHVEVEVEQITPVGSGA